jgi:hypothetical protein
MGNGVDRAGFFAGVAADADFRVDQVLPDQFGSVGGHRNGSRMLAAGLSGCKISGGISVCRSRFPWCRPRFTVLNFS